MSKKNVKKTSEQSLKRAHAEEVAKLQEIVRQEIDSRKEVYKAMEEIGSIMGFSFGYGRHDVNAIKVEIHRLKNFHQENEGRLNTAMGLLQSENERLYRLVRVAIKDPNLAPLPQDIERGQDPRRSRY